MRSTAAADSKVSALAMKAKVTAETSKVWLNTPKMSEMLGMLIAENRLVGTSTLLTFKPCNCTVAVTTTTAINAPGKNRRR